MSSIGDPGDFAQKVTFVPAQEALGLSDRGIIKEGAYADIVIFDLESIK